MIVGICKLDLYLPGHRSLKEKRHVLKGLKDRVAHAFKTALVEVGSQDLWQRGELGFAIVGSDNQFVNSIVDQVIDFISRENAGHVIEKKMEIIVF